MKTTNDDGQPVVGAIVMMPTRREKVAHKRGGTSANKARAAGLMYLSNSPSSMSHKCAAPNTPTGIPVDDRHQRNAAHRVHRGSAKPRRQPAL